MVIGVVGTAVAYAMVHRQQHKRRVVMKAHQRRMVLKALIGDGGNDEAGIMLVLDDLMNMCYDKGEALAKTCDVVPGDKLASERWFKASEEISRMITRI